MTLIATGITEEETVTNLQNDLLEVKQHLRSRNAQLTDAKEQIFGPTVAIRRAWEAKSGTAAIPTAKDLGIYHYGYSCSHPAMEK